MTAHCSHLTWTSGLHRLQQLQREGRRIHRSLQLGTVPPQVANQLKERKAFIQRVVANMQTVLLDSDLISLSMCFFCQLARWLCMQTCTEKE